MGIICAPENNLDYGEAEVNHDDDALLVGDDGDLLEVKAGNREEDQQQVVVPDVQEVNQVDPVLVEKAKDGDYLKYLNPQTVSVVTNPVVTKPVVTNPVVVPQPVLSTTTYPLGTRVSQRLVSETPLYTNSNPYLVNYQTPYYNSQYLGAQYTPYTTSYLPGVQTVQTTVSPPKQVPVVDREVEKETVEVEKKESSANKVLQPSEEVITTSYLPYVPQQTHYTYLNGTTSYLPQTNFQYEQPLTNLERTSYVQSQPTVLTDGLTYVQPTTYLNNTYVQPTTLTNTVVQPTTLTNTVVQPSTELKTEVQVQPTTTYLPQNYYGGLGYTGGLGPYSYVGAGTTNLKRSLEVQDAVRRSLVGNTVYV